MKKSEAPSFPKEQSFSPTTGIDKFFMHPDRIAWVVAPTEELRIFYHLPTFAPLRYATVGGEGKETVHEFEPATIEKSTVADLNGRDEDAHDELAACVEVGAEPLREFIRWIAWGSGSGNFPLVEPSVVRAAQKLVPK